ncbi:hypothetical protein GpartN1_g7525.t1 [Galdieria partita]|uniref:RING-type domain-containing protein n=1 Tax=Galdieria partita TaxID=83374 RepID=A0A9C7Q3P6_9RHOD|nr:hypothetical protein GpartN1_g7525.t1 [Galdieria partita]
MNEEENTRKKGSTVTSSIQQEAPRTVETENSPLEVEQESGKDMMNVDKSSPCSHIYLFTAEESMSPSVPSCYRGTQFTAQHEDISQSEPQRSSTYNASVELLKQGPLNEVSVQWTSKQGSRKTMVYQAKPVFSPRDLENTALEEEIDQRLLTATQLITTAPCKQRIFSELLKQSPVAAADFEFRNENIFLEVLGQIESSERQYFAETSKIIRFDLHRTSQLEDRITEEEWSRTFTEFKQIAVVSSVSDIVNACHWLHVFYSERKNSSLTLFLWIQNKESFQVFNILLRAFDRTYLYVNLNILEEKQLYSLFYQRLTGFKYLRCLVLKDMKMSLKELGSIVKCSFSFFVGYVSCRIICKEFEMVRGSLQNGVKELHVITSELCYHVESVSNSGFKEYWSFSKDFRKRFRFYRDKVKLGYLCKALQENCTLSILDIDSCDMDSDDARRLSEALKRNSTLDTLSIGINKINAEGAKYLSDALKVNSTLSKLSIYANNIGSQGAWHLSEAMKVNSTLKMLRIGCNNIGSEGTKYISKALLENSSLTELCIYGNNIDSQGAKYLSEGLKMNSGLRTFSLGRNSIGSEGMKDLSEAIERNSTLTTLNIYANKIGPVGAKHLFRALERDAKLTALCLGSNSIGPDGAKALSIALRTNKTLKSLQLYSNEVGPQGMKYLCEALEINSTLTTLFIGCNDIGNEGTKYLSEALKINSTLNVLYIYGNNIDSEGAQYLSDMLRRNSALVKMHIYSNNIGSEGVSALIEGLKENYTMRDIFIDNKYDSISSKDASFIRELLYRNSCFRDEICQAISFTKEEKQAKMEILMSADLRIQQSSQSASRAAVLFVSYLKHRRQLCLTDNCDSVVSKSDVLLKPLFLTDFNDSLNLGAHTEYFKSEVDSYRCGICSFICRYPRCSENCSHIFCRDCIARRLDENKACPVCESPCDSWRKVPVLESMINHLSVTCPLQCGWQGLLSVYNNCHQSECMNQMGRCSLCDLKMSLEQFTNEHLIESGCCISCRYCKQSIGAPLMEVHEHYECLMAPIQCSVCERILEYKEILSHSTVCCGAVPALLVNVERDDAVSTTYV